MKSVKVSGGRKSNPAALALVLACGFLLVAGALTLYLVKGRRLNTRDVASAEKLIGLSFTGRERKMMLSNLRRARLNYRRMREENLSNQVPPALQFNPVLPGMEVDPGPTLFSPSPAPDVPLPDNPEDIAFASLTSLARWIREGRIRSVELTRLYLDRLKKYGPQLECVITLTEASALEQARRADEEIAAGRYRGPLHGIPWGAKDLLAVKGIPTTWGAMPYKDQVIEEEATVVNRLEAAGAVLVAKLSMGALAMGDVWFGGKTRNPWNPAQGSSGSSAGSAAATAAGLVAFSIGTETLGSIVSPCTRCGASGLRPTFGRVSRHGAMALSWSMDKIGPICRSAEDCALVLHAIYGPDGKDPTVADFPFGWDASMDLEEIRVGYLKREFDRASRTRKNDRAVLETLRSLGIELHPISLPDFPARTLSFILRAEAAAAFDELTRNGRDDLLVRQDPGAWPNIFRSARLIPAVEYIQANRLRTLLMEKMAEMMEEIDVYVGPSFGGNNLLITNLTGHPTVVVPSGFDEKGNPTSISFVGKLFGEAKALRVAQAFQNATSFHLEHPRLENR